MIGKKVFIDTSAWLSSILSDEKTHRETATCMKKEMEMGTALCTSNYVVDETVTRLIYDTHWSIAEGFISRLQKSIAAKTLTELWIDEQLEAEAFTLLSKYHEHTLSMTDATTIALVKRWKIDTIMTLDTDFVKIGLSVLPTPKQ